MKTVQKVSWTACSSLMLLISGEASGVDTNRLSTHSQSAPSWTSSMNSAYSNPAYGYGSAAIDRDRTGSITQPQWNDPTRPSFDPRLAQPLDPMFNPNPYTPSTPQKWRLGIYPENSTTGVVVREVIRGSAAERAGLEVNDRVISIHGYQVGYVNGVLYDIGQELERHADSNGWAQMLVQDGRNGKLMNLPIKLDGRNEVLSGTITYNDRSSLPIDAVAVVELREVVRSDIRPITIAKQTISGIRTAPIQFTIDYDGTQIDPRRNYVLHAYIESRGSQIYRTRSDMPVLGSNPSNNVRLLVESSSYPGGINTPSRQEQLAQISRWFRQYLGREPRAQELYVWEAHLARGGTLADAQLQILSTPEFYYQSQANDAEYVRRMFEMVTNREPSQQEVSQWLGRLNYYNRMRPDVAREFLASAATANANPSVRF